MEVSLIARLVQLLLIWWCSIHTQTCLQW